MAKQKKTEDKIDKSPDFNAWFTAFFLKNHIDPFAYPAKVATREQVEFMVFPENQERYYPCSDKMYDAIISKKAGRFLNREYKQAFDRIIGLIDELIDSEYDNQFLKSLIKIKYDDEIQSKLLIPSRLEKRLYKIFLSRTHIENPYSQEKQAANKNAHKLLTSETFKKAINRLDSERDSFHELTLEQIRESIKIIEFKRLLSVTGHPGLWLGKDSKIPAVSAINQMFNIPISGDGLAPLIDILKSKKQKILWLADESGEVVVDIFIAKFMAELGHAVIFAVKEAPYYKKVCLADTKSDPALKQVFENAHFIHDKAISKNNLVTLLKHDKNLYVISDGTKEELNLLLATTTFSRVFKEVDCVISRGPSQKRRLIDTHFKFTQNIINICAVNDNIEISFKPRHRDFIKFSHEQLEKKAKKIILQMTDAKVKGMTVMFYSGIIGSIPGKIDVAKKIMSTFIDHLHNQSANLFIINPSQYYEPGMDADDLMYMWEIVQRSGYIDIWRFQTSDDIAESFALLSKKVPPEWIGKDATYSTGCTKEMRIAQDVQHTYPEMQLIGPSVDKFMRRDEYGVGSMYDRRLAEN
jgi:uncharacterized protein with ATP-grasp and redox domains